jgi:hypothetical protein
MSKKFIFAFVAYGVITFVMAAGWHLGVFASVYEQLGVFTREKPIIALGVFSMLIQAGVVAYLYPRFYRGGNPIKTGALFGFLLGLFMGSNAVLGEAGKNKVGSLITWILLEGAFYVIWPIFAGMAVGLIYGKETKKGPN